MNIIDTMNDPKLFGDSFKSDSWTSWRVTLKALFGLELTKAEQDIFHKIAGRKTPPKDCRELWVVAGRRSGKSRIAALIAVYLALFQDWSEHLSPGEKGHLLVINPDRRQGRTIINYVRALIDGVPMLSDMVIRETNDEIHFSNNVIIAIGTANFRTVSCPKKELSNRLVWRTTTIGINEITETNWEEFYARLHLVESIFPALSPCIPIESVYQHVGLKTHLSDRLWAPDSEKDTDGRFVKRLLNYLQDEASEWASGRSS